MACSNQPILGRGRNLQLQRRGRRAQAVTGWVEPPGPPRALRVRTCRSFTSAWPLGSLFLHLAGTLRPRTGACILGEGRPRLTAPGAQRVNPSPHRLAAGPGATEPTRPPPPHVPTIQTATVTPPAGLLADGPGAVLCARRAHQNLSTTLGPFAPWSPVPETHTHLLPASTSWEHPSLHPHPQTALISISDASGRSQISGKRLAL